MKYSETDLILRIENRIPAYFVSLNGQTKFYTLASMLLESAAIHSDLHGFGYHDMKREKVYWVLSRFHVIMHAYPQMNEPVIIETWHKGPSRLFFLRDYRMLSEDNRLFATATTAWLILDGNTGKPKKMNGTGYLKGFDVGSLHAIESVPDKLPGIAEPDRQVSLIARYSDLDINNHVNAIKYIEWIQDFYDEKTYASGNVQEFQINYRAETRFGDNLEIRMQKPSQEDPFAYFEGIRLPDESSAFRARIKFGQFE